MNSLSFLQGYVYKEAEMPSSVTSTDITPSDRSRRLMQIIQRTRKGGPSLYNPPAKAEPTPTSPPIQARGPATKLNMASPIASKAKPVSLPTSKSTMPLSPVKSPLHDVLLRNTASMFNPTPRSK